jgi:hypothetical protein
MFLYVANTPGLEDEITKEAAPVLERQKKFLESQGIEVVTEMPVGTPAVSDSAGSVRETRCRNDFYRVTGPRCFSKGHIRQSESCNISVCQRLFEHVLFLADFSEPSAHAFFSGKHL